MFNTVAVDDYDDAAEALSIIADYATFYAHNEELAKQVNHAALVLTRFEGIFGVTPEWEWDAVDKALGKLNDALQWTELVAGYSPFECGTLIVATLDYWDCEAV